MSKIVCLAWGSLIWKPGGLELAGQWLTDGPLLPIEFARVGDQGELATVVTPGRPPMRVRWGRLEETELERARRALQEREAIEDAKYVGTWVRGQQLSGNYEGAGEIERWALGIGDIDAVIWTALPPRFYDTDGWVPSSEAAIAYLTSLVGEMREHAFDYVRRVPGDIDTPIRRALQLFFASRA